MSVLFKKRAPDEAAGRLLMRCFYRLQRPKGRLTVQQGSKGSSGLTAYD